MSPKKRNKENEGLPKRWQFTHGAYYYRVPPGLEHLWDGKKRFRLGSSLSEAYRVWAERLEHLDHTNTIDGLLDRYALEIVPDKAPTTQNSNALSIRSLKRVFGPMPVSTLTPQDVYRYFDCKDSKVSAKRDIEVLSHALTIAVKWGVISRHPFKGEVRLLGSKPRDRYIEDWEIIEALSLKPLRKTGSILMIQAYIKIKLLTGLRRGDLLRLKLSDLQDDGIHVQPHKTAKTTRKRIVIVWTDQLKRYCDEAMAVRPVDIAPYLFCNGAGKCYVKADGTANGFDSIWQRFMARLLKETKVADRFTEHDLRAKCGSDAESLEAAQKILVHADSRLTDRTYRRKPERVFPVSMTHLDNYDTIKDKNGS